MAYGKWIGAFLGALNGGILGAMAGFAVGSLFDYIQDPGNADTDSYSNQAQGQRQHEQEGLRNGFLFSLMWEDQSRYCLPYCVFMLLYVPEGIMLMGNGMEQNMT